MAIDPVCGMQVQEQPKGDLRCIAAARRCSLSGVTNARRLNRAKL